MNAEQLVKKARKGDSAAFLQLMEREQERMYKMAYLYVKNKEDAFDIVQETVYRAFKSIVSVREPSYFSTWLIRILIHSAMDVLHKKKRLLPLEMMQEASVQDAPAEERLDLYNAIDRLNERHRTIIILRYYQDFTVREIAEVLELAEGTVKSSLHRAL